MSLRARWRAATADGYGRSYGPRMSDDPRYTHMRMGQAAEEAAEAEWCWPTYWLAGRVVSDNRWLEAERRTGIRAARREGIPVGG